MARYTAFLRGMNVGGHRLTNADLRVLFAEMGFADAACFRASGNVVFAAERQAAGEMQERIEQGLAAALGYAVPVFLRTREQVLAITGLSPFPEAALVGGGKPQVAFLAGPLSERARALITQSAGEDDLVAFGPLELHWLPRAGVLDSALDMLSIEAMTGPMTMRTMRTVRELAGKHLAA
jgi:uncharacterized protein (DUF1697 family)